MNRVENTWWNGRGHVRYTWMLVIFVSLLISLWFSFVVGPSAQAATSVPLKMNFQGRLTNSSGNILADGTYNMRLRLYSASSGGTALWSEDRLVSSSTGVTVQNGLFSIRLGDVTSLPPALFNNQTYANLYLEVELPTPATATSNSPSWSEGAMTPRNQLATSAYAFNADNLDGLDSAAFAQVGSANTFTGTNTFKNASNSTNSFAIQDSNGVNLLIADTTNDRILIGEPSADTNTTFLAVDGYSGGASDPTGGSNGAIYYNSTLGKFRCYEAATWQNCSASPQSSSSTAIQSMTAGTDTYLAGSTINLPGGGMQGPTGSNQDGTLITWRIYLTKTAAGTAASTVTLRYGTAGSTADTSRCTAFGTGTPTAAVDGGLITITAYATAGGSATTLNCSGTLTHSLPSTGLASVPVVQAFSTQTSFATNVAGTKAGLSLNVGSGSTVTVNKVETTAVNL